MEKNKISVEDNVFTIRLKNPGDEPCYTKPRHPTRSEYWSLKHRVDYMLRREEIGASISPWNSPPMLVIQPEKVKAFHQQHGNDTAEALTKSQNAEEVRVLYRFTSDMR